MRSNSAMRPSETWRRPGATGAVLLLAAVAGCGSSGEEVPTNPAVSAQAEEPADSDSALPIVIVIRPARRDVAQNILLPGSFEPYERAHLYARVTGYLDEIGVDIGDAVNKGEVLATLSIPEMAAELRRAEAQVPAARARLQKAKAEAERAQLTHQRLADLLRSEPRAVTQQSVELAAADEKVSAAQVELSRAELRAAQARVAELEAVGSYATIRAPFDSVVVARFSDVGALIVAGGKTGSKPILEVARIDKLRLAVQIPEFLVSQCRLGLGLSFKLDALPGRSFQSSISRMAGALDPETRSMRIEADVENADREFHPGMYARVSIDLGDFPGAIVLPATTLHSAGASPFVYAVENGTVRQIDVKVLKDDGADIVVEGSLGPDTQIVLAGPLRLKPGQRVRVRIQEEGP